MEEIWKPIAGFEGRYEVSNHGKFRSLPRSLIYKDGRRGMLRGSPIKGSLGAPGYISIALDTKHRRLAHRLVAEAFLEPQEYKRTINHIDGDKLNNHVDNLEWSTYAENNRHARETKLNRQHGEKSNLARHSDQFIDAIRNVHAKYAPNWEELGRLFGIRGAHARQIVLKQTRNRVTE